jgi:predicted glycoside hydrolase/deacetylase ChbG (UPF0249 family)
LKRLLVTADDFGLTPGVNLGIIEAHRRGIVTSTSLMVNAPAAAEAARLAAETPSLAVGLHFVLTFGRPVAPLDAVGPLVSAEGRFPRLDSGVHQQAPAAAIRAELGAQLEAFERRLGRPPAHLDGHHHVHALPPVLEVVLEAARRLQIPVRAPTAATQEQLAAGGVKTTGNFIDRFQGPGRIDLASLFGILEALEDGVSELMCHPAREDPALAAISSYWRERPIELGTLTSAEAREAVERLGIDLIGSSQL